MCHRCIIQVLYSNYFKGIGEEDIILSLRMKIWILHKPLRLWNTIHNYQPANFFLTSTYPDRSIKNRLFFVPASSVGAALALIPDRPKRGHSLSVFTWPHLWHLMHLTLRTWESQVIRLNLHPFSPSLIPIMHDVT